jgi:hypothetical protein
MVPILYIAILAIKCHCCSKRTKKKNGNDGFPNTSDCRFLDHHISRPTVVHIFS